MQLKAKGWRILLALGLFLAGGEISVASAGVSSVGDPGLAWPVPDDGALGEHIQEFLDTFPGEQPSFLLNTATPTGDAQGRDYLSDPTCPSATDSKCAGQLLNYQAVLPVCLSQNDLNCVVDFGTVDQNGNQTSSSFNRYFPNKALNQYLGDPALNLPSGVAGSLFSLPSATHDGGDQYFVEVSMQGSGNSNSGFRNSSLQARIYPVQLQHVTYGSANGNASDWGYSLNNRGRSDGTSYWGAAGPGFNGTKFCVADSSNENLCAARYAFPDQIRYFLKIRLQKLPGGWMHGRVKDPNISIVNGAGYSQLNIEADPVAVPAVYKMYQWLDMPQLLRANYDTQTGAYINDPQFKSNPAQAAPGGRSAPNVDPMKRNVIIASTAWSSSGMEQLKLWLPYVNDQATALLSYWSFRTLGQNEMQSANKCFTDPTTLTGIVTTNSTQYSAGPPTFNSDTGSLTYQVAAPHFTTTHDVFKGNYDLVMRSDVARCVYGFSKAPVSASISVSSADGSNEVATTMLGENNGWLHLRASNFEFSSPTINVKLTQEAPAPVATPPSVETPQASSSPVPAAKLPSPQAKKTNPKMIKIACIKGSVTRFVVATKPICPLGYKKK